MLKLPISCNTTHSFKMGSKWHLSCLLHRREFMVRAVFGDKETDLKVSSELIFLGLQKKEVWVRQVYVVAAIIYASKYIYIYIYIIHM